MCQRVIEVHFMKLLELYSMGVPLFLPAAWCHNLAAKMFGLENHFQQTVKHCQIIVHTVLSCIKSTGKMDSLFETSYSTALHVWFSFRLQTLLWHIDPWNIWQQGLTGWTALLCCYALLKEPIGQDDFFMWAFSWTIADPSVMEPSLAMANPATTLPFCATKGLRHLEPDRLGIYPQVSSPKRPSFCSWFIETEDQVLGSNTRQWGWICRICQIV